MAPMRRLRISRPLRTEVRGERRAPVHRDMGELGDPQRLKATGLDLARQFGDVDRGLRDSNENADMHAQSPCNKGRAPGLCACERAALAQVAPLHPTYWFFPRRP
jgi:hypothetical protein